MYENIFSMVFNYYKTFLPQSVRENKGLLENIPTFLKECTKKFQRTLMFLRFLASGNGQGILYGAPYGKIKLTKSFIFSYTALANGFKNAELSANISMPLSDILSTFHPHQLVFSFVLMMLETVAFDHSSSAGVENSKILSELIKIVHQQIKEVCIGEGIYPHCQTMLNWIHIMKSSGMLSSGNFKIWDLDV